MISCGNFLLFLVGLSGCWWVGKIQGVLEGGLFWIDGMGR